MPTLLQVENISLSFGERTLFENISFSINQYQKIALIARNGIGKTSLLNILAGIEAPDTGSVKLFNNASFGYLEQEPHVSEDLTVFDEVYAASKQVKLNSWEYETRVKQILFRLKLTQLDQKIAELSGGQKKRVALAKTLITEPDFIILDEPTNHLDIDMIEWLEEYLSRTSLTVLMVTHDRYFLDRICEEILEMDNGKLYRYRGNYSYFLEKQMERKENETAETEKARNLMRTEQEWMSRMPKARGTKAKARIDSFYDLREKAEGARRDQELNLTMQGERLGKKILEMHDVSFSWGDLQILKGFTHVFKRYEKVGIVGKNGTGKSTFLDIASGLLRPKKGTVDIGGTIRFGYYRQEGISFDENTRVIDVVKEIADVVKMSNGEKVSAAHFLNYFMFPYPTHQQFVYKLSGGEKRRLYLVTVLMQNPNFLILDEPTNDLDILTLNVLEEYLMSFGGCVIVVSHDRYFLDKIVDHLFVFQGETVVKDFPGNYSQYKEFAAREARKKANAAPLVDKKEKPRQAVKSGLTYKEQKELESLEREIDALEKEKNAIEKQLSSGELSPEMLTERSHRFSEILHETEAKTNRWLELVEKSES